MRGEAPIGAVWLYRRLNDGLDALVERITDGTMPMMPMMPMMPIE